MEKPLSETLIADNLFDLVKGSVLELGPHDGTWFTHRLVELSDDVAVIELDGIAVARLRSGYPGVTVMLADYHTAVQGCGHYDSVVAFGVLTHSHSPLGLMEDICNYVKPHRIFIEAEPGNQVRCLREGVNQPGQRQSRRITSGLSIQLGSRIWIDALANLGYKVIRQYQETQGDRAGREYLVFELA
jgi:hypothetical protein